MGERFAFAERRAAVELCLWCSDFFQLSETQKTPHEHTHFNSNVRPAFALQAPKLMAQWHRPPFSPMQRCATAH
ncbi:hypothetical protein, partial [Ruegeria arenilitoris]|uniref:hypothetical protein n=1 Tax=Ruegeria arenilitoris TaxID=1173585 RepID=UPI001C96E3F8